LAAAFLTSGGMVLGMAEQSVRASKMPVSIDMMGDVRM
jgi:hypothetical protein